MNAYATWLPLPFELIYSIATNNQIDVYSFVDCDQSPVTALYDLSWGPYCFGYRIIFIRKKDNTNHLRLWRWHSMSQGFRCFLHGIGVCGALPAVLTPLEAYILASTFGSSPFSTVSLALGLGTAPPVIFLGARHRQPSIAPIGKKKKTVFSGPCIFSAEAWGSFDGDFVREPFH